MKEVGGSREKEMSEQVCVERHLGWPCGLGYKWASTQVELPQMDRSVEQHGQHEISDAVVI